MQERKIKQKKFLDIPFSKKQQSVADFRSEIKNTIVTSTLFSRGKKTDAFFTEDSKLYITPREQTLIRKGILFDRNLHKWDSLSSCVVKKFVRYQPSATSLLMKTLEKRYQMLNDTTAEAARNFLGKFTILRLWNASIVGSILLGMVLMTFVYRNLGQGAAAEQMSPGAAKVTQQTSKQGEVLGAVDTKDDAESFANQVKQIEQINDKQSLEKEIRAMVKGYPIENQVSYIADEDRTVAAFYVAIAKKESGWGVHVPVLNGQDCYNYVGYRGQRKLMGSGGHTCFNSPQDAVETVSKRITALVEEQGITTPVEMVKTWKCGGRCDLTGGQAAANKWAVDVESIFRRFSEE